MHVSRLHSWKKIVQPCWHCQLRGMFYKKCALVQSWSSLKIMLLSVDNRRHNKCNNRMLSNMDCEHEALSVQFGFFFFFLQRNEWIVISVSNDLTRLSSKKRNWEKKVHVSNTSEYFQSKSRNLAIKSSATLDLM